MSRLPFIKPKDEVSADQLLSLLRGRKFGSNANEDPQFRVVDPIEMKKLEDFCAKHGIIGVNFGNITDPVRMLQMLKSRMGIVEQPSSQNKGLLYG